MDRVERSVQSVARHLVLDAAGGMRSERLDALIECRSRMKRVTSSPSDAYSVAEQEMVGGPVTVSSASKALLPSSLHSSPTVYRPGSVPIISSCTPDPHLDCFTTPAASGPYPSKMPSIYPSIPMLPSLGLGYRAADFAVYTLAAVGSVLASAFAYLWLYKDWVLTHKNLPGMSLPRARSMCCREGR